MWLVASNFSVEKATYQFLSLPLEMSLLIQMLKMTLVSSSTCWLMKITFDLDLRKREMQWAWIYFKGTNTHSRNLSKCVCGRSKGATKCGPSSNITFILYYHALWLFIFFFFNMNQSLISVQIKCKYFWWLKFLNQTHFEIWSQEEIGIFTNVDVIGLLFLVPRSPEWECFYLADQSYCLNQSHFLYKDVKVANNIPQRIHSGAGEMNLTRMKWLGDTESI